MTLQITRVDWNVGKVLRRVSSGVKDAHESAVARVIELVEPRTPLDTGRLIGDATEDSDEDGGTISYATPYAAILHEHPEWNFQNGREGKWLERSLNESGRTVLGEFADEMEDALR